MPPPSNNMDSAHPSPNDCNATSQTGSKNSIKIIRASEIYGTLMATNQNRTQNFPLTLQQALIELKNFEPNINNKLDVAPIQR